MTPPSGPATVDEATRPVTVQRAPRPVADDVAVRATLGGDRKSGWEQFALGVFVFVPFLALIAAIPVMWGWGLGWHDVVIAAVMYAISGHGVTIGYHRLFTHKAFKANRWLRVVLAFAGGMAIEGPVVRWVADHRRHHAFSDRDGDPHSPWRFGNSIGALTKGLLYAHMGWLFDPEQTDVKRYAPDLIADRDVVRVSRLFWLQVTLSLALPPLVGGLWSMSFAGALTAFFWGALVRVSLLLLSAGWCAFLGSCLLSVWIIRHNLPLVSFAELLHGSRAAVFDALPEAQRQLLQGIFWMTQGLQWAGAALFFGGLGSVAFFDKRDGVPAYSAD